MDKREFLKKTGMLSLASLLPLERVLASVGGQTRTNTCTLIPSETAGPFPLDLTTNSFYFRQDVRENKTGAQLNLRLKIIGDQNCLPMPNLRVNIWHCDKDGLYSGYSQAGNAGQAGLTYLRGYQMTDANGEVEFITIFPGWYNGRVCHIHFQVYVSSSYAAISQLTFDVPTKQAIYAAYPSLYTNGADPIAPGSDGIFSDGYTFQITTPTPDIGTGGYDAYLEVTIQGNGTTTGLGHIERETAKQFAMGQNFPNPFVNETTIPVNLIYPSEVKLDLYDLQGRIVKTIDKGNLSSGDHEISINLNELGISKGNYAYQLEIKNQNGTFRDVKLMTCDQ